MVAKRKNPIDELFDQFMEGLFKMAEFFTGEARVKVESAGGASLNEKGKMKNPIEREQSQTSLSYAEREEFRHMGKNEKLKCEDEKTESFLIVPIKSEQVGTEASKRTRKRKRVKMVEGDLFGG
jgi:hypothetical protein